MEDEEKNAVRSYNGTVGRAVGAVGREFLWHYKIKRGSAARCDVRHARTHARTHTHTLHDKNVISFASASQTLLSKNYKKKHKKKPSNTRSCFGLAVLPRWAEPSRETFHRSKQRQGIFEDCQHFSFSFSLRVRPVNPISLCFTFVFSIIWRCARSQNQITTPVLSPVDYHHKRDGKLVETSSFILSFTDHLSIVTIQSRNIPSSWFRRLQTGICNVEQWKLAPKNLHKSNMAII